MTPHKLAVITSATGEVLRSANAETLIRQALAESVGPALDKALFSSTAASAVQPAGLLAGIAPLTPASGASGKDQLIVDDLQALTLAIAPVSGNNGVVIVASPDAAVSLRLRVLREDVPILVSASLAAKTVIMIATAAVASAVEGSPAIEATSEAAFVRDSTPQEVVTAAGTVATSLGSMWQTDQIGLKVRWSLSWGLRSRAGSGRIHL